MIPYWAPLAAMPMISMAPRFAEMNASPVTQAGSDRPDRKKSSDDVTSPLQREPDAEDEAEVDHQEGDVQPAELQSQGFRGEVHVITSS